MLFGLKTADPLRLQKWRHAVTSWLGEHADSGGQVECHQATGLTILWITGSDATPAVWQDASRIFALYGTAGPDATGRTGLELLQHRYAAEGIHGLCGLNGRYNAAVYQKQSGLLELANDTLGLLPLYYTAGKDFLAFGARCYPFRFVPGFDTRLDLQAASDLLQLGYVIGDRTLNAQARRVPAGAVVCYGADHHVRTTTVAKLPFTAERWATPVPELAMQMGEILTGALRRGVAAARPGLIPLSGGLDSRVLAVLAARLHLDCRAVSFGTARNRDAIIARRVADALGIPHSIVPVPADAIAVYLPRHLRLIEGNTDATSGYWFALVDAVGADAPWILPGHLGDAASGAHLPALDQEDHRPPEVVFDAAFDAAVRKEGGFSVAELAACMTPEAFAQSGEATRAESRRVFFSRGEHNFQRMLHWDLLLRQRLFICADMLIAADAGPVVCPFADSEFLRFVVTLPQHALTGQRAYRAMLASLAPRVARIITADSRHSLLASWQKVLWPRLGQWRMGMMARHLRLLRGQKDWWASVYGPSPGLDRVLSTSIQHLHGIFRPAFLADLRAIHPARRRKLALLAKWLECNT